MALQTSLTPSPIPRAAQSSEEGFRDFAESLIQHIDEVFFWINPGESRPYYVSQAYARIWGQSCDSVYAEPSSWLESIHPEDKVGVLKTFQRAREIGHTQIEYRILHPQGGIRWIWARTFPVYDSGAISRVIGIAQDYTERKIAEQNRAFLAAIVESSDDSIIATNLEGTIVSWNAAAQSLFGYSAEEVIGQTIMLLFPQDQRGNVVPVLGRIQERGFTERTESIRVAKGERPIEVSVILSPVRDSSGTLQGISAIYRDIGERKKAERERESMEVQLRHAQKMESIGQLAAGIAHEINTPAQYIGDNTRFLKDSFGEMEEALRSQQALLALLKAGGTSPVGGEEIEAAIGRIDLEYLLTEVPKAIDQTLDGIQRITTLVGAMKEFSHPGKKEKVSTDLNSAIDNTITVARNEWKYVAEMETDYDPSLPLVPCLAGDFSQVILNLIVNAAHAIADVAKNGARGRITIRTRSRAPWAEVQVQDTGGGVPEAVRERIFEPFFTTKDVGRGTGQGLAIAHTVVVDKHGGTISYETEMGRGTTFTIRIPLQNIVQES